MVQSCTALRCAPLALALLPAVARADTAAPASLQSFAIHAQSTFVLQGVPDFRSPYAGTNSLIPGQRKETFDATLYVGVSPWKGMEIWANPEIDQGFGLSNTLGVAGYVSGEAYKVGKKHPYVRLQRLFLRQTIDLGGDQQAVDAAANQLGGHHSANRIVLTIGKISTGDIFDTNKYAHDPRGDFLNWSVIDSGSFDYAAEAWGYTYGVAAEWYQGPWAFRFGALNLSKVPNGTTLESDFSQYQLVGEIEHRHQIGGRDGALRVTAFRSSGRFGTFADALSLARATGTTPDTSAVQQQRSRAGVDVNLEQAVTDTIGVFARGGLADGSVAPYDFTDIDRSVSAGASINGKSWGRDDDTIGIAGVVNGISSSHRRYFAAGGLGVLVGDGQLKHYGPEEIAEAYYSFKPAKPLAITLDYQFIAHPGYNRDRGPANVIGVRLHGQF